MFLCIYFNNKHIFSADIVPSPTKFYNVCSNAIRNNIKRHFMIVTTNNHIFLPFVWIRRQLIGNLHYTLIKHVQFNKFSKKKKNNLTQSMEDW